MEGSQHDLLIAIVNQGFGDQVMDVARENGAKGGTIINARGTSRPEVENKYGIVIHPEKEMVLILVNSKIKDKILYAIYEKVGLDTPGQGIAFTTHIDEAVGLKHKKVKKNEEKQEEKEENESTKDELKEENEDS